MRNPKATYRLQFHPRFTFADAQKIIGYLADLGVSDVYASPIFKARKESFHGYDVVDPTQINPQLGGQEAFGHLVATAQGRGLGWLQDIVPNHMAFDSHNRLLMDVLENGPHSKYYQFFDIEWNHPYGHLKGRLLAPFLGDLYGRCLDRNEIRLAFDESGFNIRYHDWKFPLRIESYTKVLAAHLPWFEDKIQREEKDYIQFLEISNQFKALTGYSDANDYYNKLALLKAQLWKLYLTNPVIKAYIDAMIVAFNGVPGDAHSLNKLDDLLSEQYFKLSFWKVGNEELNYRRFFTINGLLSVRVEDQEVFEYTHNFLFSLIKAGQITGVRIDHIDGLLDPIVYLNKLRQRGPDLYIVIEKILDLDEPLPSSMPVQGTTGYDFMNVANEVFIDRTSENALDRFYVSFTGQHTSYRTFVCEKKKLFMGQHMAGDIDNLAHRLKQIINADRYGGDMTMYALRRTIVEIMAQFPVYRAYMREGELSEDDRIHIKEAIAAAENRNPGLANELQFISKILLLEFPPDINTQKKEEYYAFTKKFQQFSGALMAKGAEDTAFYIYNRFISLNEVGGDPSIFGLHLKEFHDFMLERQKKWPATINATSTHDTKRGEDVRARLNVLSEIPKQWQQHVTFWHRINKKKKRNINGTQAPDRNDEYFIYQTLVGAYPFAESGKAAFLPRMKEYMVKALREAKVHTNWIRQDTAYENACLEFLESLLEPAANNRFLNSFLVFQKQIAKDGVLNSLSQTLLKMTCPGIPDFYQGTELWDFSLVDPDNRRPVDYSLRMQALAQAGQVQSEDQMRELLDNPADGRVKMFLIRQILAIRQRHPHIFLKGEYLPLEVKGKLNKYVIAFARKTGNAWAMTAVPRFSRQFAEEQHRWDQAILTLPADAPESWTNAITGEAFAIKGSMSMQALFQGFPVAFLIGPGL